MPEATSVQALTVTGTSINTGDSINVGGIPLTVIDVRDVVEADANGSSSATATFSCSAATRPSTSSAACSSPTPDHASCDGRARPDSAGNPWQPRHPAPTTEQPGVPNRGPVRCATSTDT